MKKKIWIRLGGFIEVDSENELEKIKGGDKGVLMSVIKRNGFEPNVDGDIDFDFSGGKKLR